MSVWISDNFFSHCGDKVWDFYCNICLELPRKWQMCPVVLWSLWELEVSLRVRIVSSSVGLVNVCVFLESGQAW